jgi:chorismate mutase
MSGVGSPEPPKSAGAGSAGTGAGKLHERVDELRARLVQEDERIVAAFNRRLELVAELKRVKQELGVDFLDPGREQWLREHLAHANGGPLSAEGLDELVTVLLDLTKREL